jgi:hypothetical protein
MSNSHARVYWKITVSHMTSEMFLSSIKKYCQWLLFVAGLLSFMAGIQIFQKSWSHIKIPGVRWVTWSRFYFEDPHVRRHRTKFSWPGDLAPGICASLVCGIRLLWWFPHSTPGSIYEFPRGAVGTLESTHTHRYLLVYYFLTYFCQYQHSLIQNFEMWTAYFT